MKSNSVAAVRAPNVHNQRSLRVPHSSVVIAAQLTVRRLLSALLLSTVASSLSAQSIGSEFQVNSSTTSAQTRPAAGADAAGNVVVVWQSLNQDAPDGGSGIFGQRYDAAGARVGPEFRVNTTVIGDQTDPAIAVAADGAFAVFWAGTDGAPPGIFGQHYDAWGERVGSEFVVTSEWPSRNPSAAFGPDGSMFVAYLRNPSQTWDGWTVFAQRRDPTGVPLGPELQVNVTPISSPGVSRPQVASDASGNFVVVWARVRSSWSPQEAILARRFTGDGMFGEELVVDTNGYSATRPTVALWPTGNFVVAWEGAGDSIYARQYSQLDVALGPRFRVSTLDGFRVGMQTRPTVALDPSAKIAVVGWPD